MTAPIKQPSFSGGEISPTLYARADNAIYEKSLRTERNMITMRQGGITGRPGTMYVGTALNGGNPVRLIPFVFNETGLGQSYMLEFGDQYITFYQNGNNVISSAISVSAVTAAHPPVVTANAHGFSDDDEIFFTGVIGMTQLNNAYYVVKNVTINTFELYEYSGPVLVPADGSLFDPYISSGIANKIYIISSPYTQNDLQNINFAQSADILTITNQNYSPYELSRLSNTSWVLANIQSKFGAPLPGPSGLNITGTFDAGHNVAYLVSSVDSNGEESDDSSTNGRISDAVGVEIHSPSPTMPVTISWSALPNAVRYRIYAFVDNGNTAGFIGETTSISFIDTGIAPDFSIHYPAFVSPLLAGFPANVGFSQQRRVFSNFTNNPVGFAMSQPGDFYNFNPSFPQQDSDGIIASVAGQEVNAIEAFTELKFSLILTAGAEIYIQGNGSGVITPASINASVQSYYGCSSLRPIRVSDVLIFNQSLGSFIRDLSFDFAIDGYRGNDITVFATHLFEGYQINDWAYQKVPDSLIWAVRSDGVLLSCTYVREQQVLAWAHHDFVNGEVENICAIPENGEYAVYLSIKRLINGAAVRYIERISSRIWEVPNDPITSSALDSFLFYDGRNTGSTTMRLLGIITIVPEVNDGIAFSVNSIDYFAVIPPGVYNPTQLAGTIAIAMNAQINIPFMCQISAGKFKIFKSGVDTIVLKFNTGDPNFSRSIGLTLGFPLNDYTFTDNTIAPDYAITTFSSDSTAYQQSLTVISNEDFYFANRTTPGNQIFLQDDEWVSSQGKKGKQIRLTIQTVNDLVAASAHVTPSGVVPIEFHNSPTTNWSYAVKSVSGLRHLEQQEVSIWADRFVVGSPLNYHIQTTYTVENGIVNLDKPYSVIYIGLPMIQDAQTLDLETVGGESLLASRKRSARLNIYLYNSRTLFCASENPDTNLQNVNEVPLFQMYELRSGTSQVNYDQPPPLITDQDYVIPETRYNKNGRLFIRNVDPVPLTILAIGVEGESKASNPAYARV